MNIEQQLQSATDFYTQLALEVFGKNRVSWRYNSDTLTEFWERTAKKISVSFNLKGKTAGTASPLNCKIEYNKALAENNLQEFLDRTVPHEVAHIFEYYLFGTCGHKRGWKVVMQKLGVKDISRCHSYDVSAVKTRTTRATYQAACDCMVHEIGGIMYKRMMTGERVYRCKKCGVRISAMEEIDA